MIWLLNERYTSTSRHFFYCITTEVCLPSSVLLGSDRSILISPTRDSKSVTCCFDFLFLIIRIGSDDMFLSCAVYKL